jgi:hypothetical protein
MSGQRRVQILPQPDETTCGPTCLHALYRYYGDSIELSDVIAHARRLEGGGTLAVLLALHALRRGYAATLYTYNLQLFDPTWFKTTDGSGVDVRERLVKQAQEKDSPKLRAATEAYLEYLDLGGKIRYEDLTPKLVRRYLRRGNPVLTGLSATYLYQCAREIPETNKYDDIRGAPAGHFVVLSHYDAGPRTVGVSDPYLPNPTREHYYEVPVLRLVGAIMLGIVTYDANLLILEPPGSKDDPWPT